MTSEGSPLSASLPIMAGEPHAFATPSKRINDGQDLPIFLVSSAYRDIMTFLVQLNRAMFPNNDGASITTFELDSQRKYSTTILDLRKMLEQLDQIIDEVPPDPGPRRFGNMSFRKWIQNIEDRSKDLLEQYLPEAVKTAKSSTEVSAVTELRAYLLGSFGSAQRLDYGTGHELSFLAFLGCIWKLGGFSSDGGNEERGIVMGVIHPYLNIVRKLIITYSLEPAGSHGVWGLDDHSFLPYIFGSAQYGPPTKESDPIPVEGSLEGAPNPGGVVNKDVVERERKKNLYFGAIGFIYDVKKGPFWEHSPTLYDISGVRAGWGKINKGMVKMYSAEVLSKFPVVQHFSFGSLFSFDRDANATLPASTVHSSSQPSRESSVGSSTRQQNVTRAPWATGASPMLGPTTRPTAPSNTLMPPPTKAPWAR